MSCVSLILFYLCFVMWASAITLRSFLCANFESPGLVVYRHCSEPSVSPCLSHQNRWGFPGFLCTIVGLERARRRCWWSAQMLLLTNITSLSWKDGEAFTLYLSHASRVLCSVRVQLHDVLRVNVYDEPVQLPMSKLWNVGEDFRFLCPFPRRWIAGLLLAHAIC